MVKSKSAVLHGVFKQLIYSRKGRIEGFLLEALDGPQQVLVDKNDARAVTYLLSLTPNAPVEVAAVLEGPSGKGVPVHPVYTLKAFAQVPRLEAFKEGWSGTIQRFNYARHGEPNGVVLDNGHFIYLRPEAFYLLGLCLGGRITAIGPARQLADGSGVVVEAVTINGVPVQTAAEAALPAAIHKAPTTPAIKKLVPRVARKRAAPIASTSATASAKPTTTARKRAMKKPAAVAPVIAPVAAANGAHPVALHEVAG